MAIPTPAAVGSVIAGKYRVERTLGQGGMGFVVAAWHLHLGVRVAIKFPVANQGPQPLVAARLLREARAAMRIRSEHVRRVFDADILPSGDPYVVMEYLDGLDLAAVVARDGPLEASAVVAYLLQAIEAIAEAHSHGIIHRDLKPSNLFLARRADQSPLVKVIDFGISKSPCAVQNGSLATASGTMGTPLYMAPEQMVSARDVDVRADIWALGATAYALMTGRAPFPAESTVEIYERIGRGPPSLRAARPDAPAALETVLCRCLEREPDARYPNVAELAASLAELAPPAARISAERAARTLEAREFEGTSSGATSAEGANPPTFPTHPEAAPSWTSVTIERPEWVPGRRTPAALGPISAVRSWSRWGLIALLLTGAGGTVLGFAVVQGRTSNPVSARAAEPSSASTSPGTRVELTSARREVASSSLELSAARMAAPPERMPAPTASSAYLRVEKPESPSRHVVAPPPAAASAPRPAPRGPRHSGQSSLNNNAIVPHDPLADPD